MIFGRVLDHPGTVGHYRLLSGDRIARHRRSADVNPAGIERSGSRWRRKNRVLASSGFFAVQKSSHRPNTLTASGRTPQNNDGYATVQVTHDRLPWTLTVTQNCIVFKNGVFRSSDHCRKTVKNCVDNDETASTHASARTLTENWITTTGFFIRARSAMVRRLGGSSYGRVRWRIAIPRFRQHWLTLCADDYTRAFVVNEPKTRSPHASLSVHRSSGYVPCV